MAAGLGGAVIGAGMADKADAAAYRAASALERPVLMPIRLVSSGDVKAQFGSIAAHRWTSQQPDLRGVLRERRCSVRPTPAGRDRTVPVRSGVGPERLSTGNPKTGAPPTWPADCR